METNNSISKARTIADIVSAIDVRVNGSQKYLKTNIEADEWSYEKQINTLRKEGKITQAQIEELRNSVTGNLNYKLDRRFSDGYVSVLVEVKNNFDDVYDAAIEQLRNYVKLEKLITNNEQIIAILANKNDSRIIVWKGDVYEGCRLRDEKYLRSFDKYKELFYGRKDDPYKVERCAYELNDMLHSFGVNAKCRADLLAGCIRTLNYYTPSEFQFSLLGSKAILSQIEECTEELLKTNKGFVEQNSVLKKIFEHPSIKELKPHHWHKILNKLMLDLIPYVNHGTCVGQDILNVFYTVFNKYVGKKDRNQAFTPNHLVHFLCKVAEVNRNSYVLDPTCGSGSFLIRAMVDGVEDAKGDETMINSFKKSHIYGIEADEKAWGYTISNMLLHDNVEGCDNIIKSNCFKVSDETIKGWGIDTVIMNPPFNAQRVYCWDEYATEHKWKDDAEDPTKGFHFALWAAQKVGKGKLVVILPTACAIADKTNHELHEVKKLMLEEHTLDAVFSLPSDIFLPGASVNVCCMVFTLGKRHNPNKPSFFGYFKEDGFGMKKHLGRVEKKIGTWDEIEKKWLELYFSKKEENGLSCVRCVTADDEWCAEEYMETDYTKLTDSDFEQSIRNFVAFHVANDNKF